jgi:hypothetical protein
MYLGEPLRRAGAPEVRPALLASGYPLHHLRACSRTSGALRLSLRWFRCYPSRYSHLWCEPASRAGIGALCAPLVSSMLVSSTCYLSRQRRRYQIQEREARYLYFIFHRFAQYAPPTKTFFEVKESEINFASLCFVGSAEIEVVVFFGLSPSDDIIYYGIE